MIYSFLLVEATAKGNQVRVQADNLNAPFDFNKSVKLELGSTAKLRAVTHYLEIIAELHKSWPGWTANSWRSERKARTIH